ncbi:hypothetical protein K438DRAFT_1934826 [Mycena galopus ATCC 62051]|nr:hypothetical protein K438DRAFT_1934826 [Mycena galopus ATCC 62051]
MTSSCRRDATWIISTIWARRCCVGSRVGASSGFVSGGGRNAAGSEERGGANASGMSAKTEAEDRGKGRCQVRHGGIPVARFCSSVKKTSLALKWGLGSLEQRLRGGALRWCFAAGALGGRSTGGTRAKTAGRAWGELWGRWTSWYESKRAATWHWCQPKIAPYDGNLIMRSLSLLTSSHFFVNSTLLSNPKTYKLYSAFSTIFRHDRFSTNLAQLADWPQCMPVIKTALALVTSSILQYFVILLLEKGKLNHLESLELARDDPVLAQNHRQLQKWLKETRANLPNKVTKILKSFQLRIQSHLFHVDIVIAWMIPLWSMLGVDSRPLCGDKAGDASADVGTAKNLLTSAPDTLLPIGLTRSFDASGTGGGLNIGSVAFARVFLFFSAQYSPSPSSPSSSRPHAQNHPPPSGAQTPYPTTTALTYAACSLRASPARRVRHETHPARRPVGTACPRAMWCGALGSHVVMPILLSLDRTGESALEDEFIGESTAEGEEERMVEAENVGADPEGASGSSASAFSNANTRQRREEERDLSPFKKATWAQ